MVSMDKASLATYLNASTAEKTINARRGIAAAMIKVGATKPEAALNMAKIANGDWGLSRGVLYSTLKNSPGFVSRRHPDTDQFQYWYEADKMVPYAMQQGVSDYPPDLKAVGMSIFNGESHGTGPKPLWEVDPEKAEVGLATVPYRVGVNVEELTEVMGQFITRIEEAPVRRMLIRNLIGLEVDSRKGLE